MTTRAGQHRAQQQPVPAPDRAPSCLETVTAAAERITGYRRTPHIFRRLDLEQALAQAQAVDLRVSTGGSLPLAGICVVVDGPAGSDSDATDDHAKTDDHATTDEPDVTEELIRRLRAAGAVVIGVTSPAVGAGRVGGGAIALSAGLVPVAVVDGAAGGDVAPVSGREPVLFRPATWTLAAPGSGSAPGLAGRWPALLAASTVDVRRIWDALLPESTVTTPAANRRRVGISVRPPEAGRSAGPRMVDAVEDVAAVLSAVGYEVVNEDLDRPRARGVPHAERVRAAGALVTPWDLGYPVTLRLAWPRAGQLRWVPDQSTTSALRWRAAGCSTLALPVDWTEHGTPLGVRLVVSAGSEPTLFELAGVIEDRLPVR